MSLTSKFNPKLIKDILNEKTPKRIWLWDKLIAEGDFGAIVGYAKVGKSTFYSPLAQAIARGDSFLGSPTTQSPVLILSLEEHNEDVKQRFIKLDAENEPLHVHRGLLSFDDLAEIRAYVRGEGIKIVFIDPLSKWWRIQNENDNAEIERRLIPHLEFVREDNVALFFNHHSNKYGGRDPKTGESYGDGRDIRGGSALFGNFDQTLNLYRAHGGTPDRRRLHALGRHAERKLLFDVEGVLDLDSSDSYSLRVIGDPAEVKAEARREKLLPLITNEPKTKQQLFKESGISNEKAVERLLKELVREGNVIEDDERRPYTYRLSLQPADLLHGVPIGEEIPGYDSWYKSNTVH